MSDTTEPLLFNPFDPAVRSDPYPLYRRMQEEDPTYRSPLGFNVFTRYDDCLTVLRHPQMSSDAATPRATRSSSSSSRRRGRWRGPWTANDRSSCSTRPTTPACGGW